MIDLSNKRYAFTLVEEQKTVSGGYIPCIAVEGESGYHPMRGQGEGAAPWDWGSDRDTAQHLCDERNERMGLSKEDALRLILGTMEFIGGWHPTAMD